MLFLHPAIFSNNIASRGPAVHAQGDRETHPGPHRAAGGEGASLVLQGELGACSVRPVWKWYGLSRLSQFLGGTGNELGVIRKCVTKKTESICFASWKLGRSYSKLRYGLAKERGPRRDWLSTSVCVGAGMRLSCVLLGPRLGVSWRQLRERLFHSEEMSPEWFGVL